MKLYKVSYVDKLIDKYYELNGDVYIIDEGCLAYGLVICKAEGKKSCVIKEVYINSWSSGQSVRFYNKLPKKYEDMIEEYINKEDE